MIDQILAGALVTSQFAFRLTEQSRRVYVGFLTRTLTHIHDPVLVERTSPAGDPPPILSNTKTDTPQHSSLQKYKHQITLAHAEFSLWRQKPKFSLTLLRRLTTSVSSLDSPQTSYLAFLKIISQHLSLHEFHAALPFVDRLRDSSFQHQHSHVTLLSHVLRLRILVVGEFWPDAGLASRTAEDALGLRYQTVSALASATPTTFPTYLDFEDRFECVMALHTLVLSIIYYAKTGISSESSVRLSHLHALLDAKALGCPGDGSIKVYRHHSPRLWTYFRQD